MVIKMCFIINMESDNTMLINKYDVLNFFNRFQFLKGIVCVCKNVSPKFYPCLCCHNLFLPFFGYAKFIGVDKVLRTTRRKCLCGALL